MVNIFVCLITERRQSVIMPIFFLLVLMMTGFTMQAQTLSPAATASFCAGGSVTLTVNGAPTGSSFQWKLGTGNVGTDLNTFSVTIAGSYTVVDK